jgi:poly(beta-D-mannuronate) C5 epimerase
MLVSFSLTNSEVSTSSSSTCVTYIPSKRLITVTCDIATLTDVYHQLKDDNILKKEDDKSANRAIWLLNAKLLIEKNSKFVIGSNDTAWLKIVSDETTDVYNNIIVYGSMKIDSVKITSWNPKNNNYATNLGPEPPRAFIRVMKEATGTTDIINSEIAYLGYSPKIPPRAGVNSGLNYDGGNGSVLRGNNIHHMWAGIYTRGVSDIVIEGNVVHHNYHYGLDPHTGTHDVIIRNNIVHDNGEEGIICSLDCYNIIIENNEVYDNTQAGIMFSRNMTNSVARNNDVHDETKGVFLSESNNNQIYNNIISNSKDGIYLKSGSSNNEIYNNTVTYAISNGILINAGSSRNMFYSNTIINTTGGYEINVKDPSTSVDNKFENNHLIHSRESLQ